MSSTTTILELRQEDALSGFIPTVNGNFQNGVWETTLDVPIQLEDGDQVQVKSVYLDTSLGQSGYISVPSDITVNMKCAMYLTNYEKDQQYTFKSGVGELRKYPLGNNKPAQLRPKNEVGDNNKWFLSYLSTSNRPTVRIPTIKAFLPHISKARAGITWIKYQAVFQYTGVEPGAVRFGKTWQYTSPDFRYNDFYKYTPFNCGVVCTADPSDATIPDFRLSSVHGIDNGAEMKLESRITFDFQSASIPTATGKISATCQEFPLTFVIPGGKDVVYSPLEISKFITDKLSNLEQTGQASTDYALANDTDINNMTKFPAMSPFLTTVLKNKVDLFNQSTILGHELSQIFINADGYQNTKFPNPNTVPPANPPIPYPDPYNPDGNHNGNLQMEYNIGDMLTEYTAGQKNALDVYVGSNQVALEYDEVVNKLKFTQLHFPIYSGDTISANISANDASPSVCYSPAETANPYFATKGLVLQYSGIVFTQLDPPSFWESILGFTGVEKNPNYNQGFMKEQGAAVPSMPPTQPNSFEFIVEEGVNITGGLPSLDVAVVHSSAGFSYPIRADPTNPLANGGMSTPVITDDVKSIYSSRTWNTAPASHGYFLLDIATNFQQNMVGQTLKTNTTQSIVNRYYTADSFTSDQGQGSIVYQHKGEPQMLSNFRVKVLNPDRTLTAEHILQERNTVFIEVVKQNNGGTEKKK